jgi:hypothetical protein
VGVVAQSAPLGLAAFATGPSVALRTSRAPYTLGLRAAYAFTPLPRDGVSLQRLSVQGLVGLRDTGPIAPFLEAAGGWSLVAVNYPLGTSQGDPTVLSAHLSGGVVLQQRPVPLRVAALFGVDLVTADGGERGDRTWGVEVTLGF